ncbi:MAG: isocitrate lyase/phosphoenolpyruvate mutase family protein [Candidatus Omnitrophica bacterium]|nr:isocitrate lyase/phosphoenolpyruvate mutase family protein [Candidatus Omnitrophota bacterium]
MERAGLVIQFFSLSFLFLRNMAFDFNYVDENLRRIRNIYSKAEQIRKEWAEMEARGRYIKRDYTAEQVARLRSDWEGPGAYPLQTKMAWKLYDQLRIHQKNKTAIITIGAFDEVSEEALARSGLGAGYVGGWAESMRQGTADTAQYAYDFVRRFVGRVSRMLVQHDRHLISQGVRAEEREKFLMPLVVDMDTGHGAPMNMTELMLKPSDDSLGDPPLIGAIHIEDQAVGCKKCGHLAGKVLVDTQAFIDRLKAVRLQLDVMGIPTLLIARTDAEAAEYITSTKDSRDHPFILGVTNPKVKPYAATLEEAWAKGKSEGEVAEIAKEWKENAGLMTLGEAIAQAIKLAIETTGYRGTSLEEWRNFAKSASFQQLKDKAGNLKITVNSKLKEEATKLGFVVTGDNGQKVGIIVHTRESWENFHKKGAKFPQGINLFWDMDQASIAEDGYTLWMINSGLEMAIARSKAFLPYADISWMEQSKPDAEEIEEWSRALDEEAQKLGIPKEFAPLKAMNISPSFYWPGAGYTEQQLSTFYDRMAKAGVQFQFNTYGGAQLIYDTMLKFVEEFKKDQALAWRNFQSQAMKAGNPFVSNSQVFAGVLWVVFRDTTAKGRTLVASPLGERSTMGQFGGGN